MSNISIMNFLNRHIFILCLAFLGLSAFDQTSHILDDHGLNEKAEHLVCVLDNPEPTTPDVIINRYVYFSVENEILNDTKPLKVYSFNSRAPPRKI